MLCPPATDTEFQHLTDEQKAKEMLIQLIYSRHLTSKSAAVDININPNGHITLYIPNKHALEHILNKELNFDLGLRGKQLQPEWILMMLAMQCEGYQPSSNAATKQLVKIAVGKTIYNLNGFTKLNLLRKYFMRHGSAYYQQLCNYTVDTLDGDMELILTLFPGCTHLTAANLAENMPAFLQQLDDIKKIAASKDESFQHTALFLVLCQSSIKQYIHDNIAFHRHTTLTDYKKELLEFIKSHGLQHFASLGIDFTRQYGVEALLEQYKMVASDIASIFTSHLFNDTPHSKHFKPLVDYLNKATTPSINLPCQRLSDLIKQRIEINAKLRQQQMDYQATQGARVSPVALVNRPH
jgi:hypothetical protein